MIELPLPQLPLSPFGVETTSPLGRTSSKLIELRLSVVLGFVIVNVMEVLAPSSIELAPNPNVKFGPVTTVIVDWTVLLSPSLPELTEKLLVWAPSEVPVTETTTSQLPPAEIVPPLMLQEVAPGVAVTLPPPREPPTGWM